MTRILSLVIGVLPLVFVFFVPAILKLSFFTRALRLSIAIVAVIGFYLPLFRSNLGATLGLLGAAVATTVWYVLGNPYGIDNMYIAAADARWSSGHRAAFGWNTPSTAPTVAPADPTHPTTAH